MYRITLLLVNITLLFAQNSSPDYYWRDYNGNIPEDAIEGGKDINGNPTYIGQAFVLNHGLLIAPIYPRVKTLVTSRLGIHYTDVSNKILCSPYKEKFYWAKGNSKTLFLTSANQYLVPGGMENGKVLHIGRLHFKNEIIIAKVCSGETGNAKMYFPYKGEELDAESYEILAYHDKLEIDRRIRLNYYWRDYNGEIAEDAIEAGEDNNGDTIYIGQAFVLSHGVLIAPIYPGIKTLVTSHWGLHYTSVYNKILCSQNKGKFYWTPVNSQTLFLTSANLHLVPGGMENGKLLHIGRVNFQDATRVGKVCSGEIGDARLYLPYQGQEWYFQLYEILAYSDNKPTIDARLLMFNKV